MRSSTDCTESASALNPLAQFSRSTEIEGLVEDLSPSGTGPG
jgi:hypothetical protein